MRRAPLFFVLLPFMAGIGIALSVPLPLLVPLAVATAVTAAMVLLTLVRRFAMQGRRLFALLLVVDMLAMGSLAVPLRDPLRTSDHYTRHIAVGAPATFSLRLVDTPVARSRSWRAEAEVEQVLYNGEAMQCRGRVMLYLAADSAASSLRCGDRLMGCGRLSLPNSSNNPYQFDYRRYLLRHGVALQLYLPADGWRRCGPDAVSLSVWSHRLQYHLVQRLRHDALSKEQQGVAEALLLGWRADLDESTRARFRDAGVLHLLCVSGLHVGIVAAIVGAALFFLRRGRWRLLRGALQLAAVWIFVLISGMAPATIRAAVMFSLFIIASMLGRRTASLNLLAASALLMLCLRPTLLVDVGFQLSYGAVLGIIVLYKPFVHLIPAFSRPVDYPRAFTVRNVLVGVGKRVWQLICLSTAAQLACLPFLLYHFHQFSCWFLVANLLIIPLATLLLATVLLLVIVAPLTAIAGVMTRVLAFELCWVDGVTRWVQHLPGATLTNCYCDLPVALLLLAILVSLTTLLYRYHRRQTLAPTVFLAALSGVVLTAYLLVVRHHADQRQDWIVYSLRGHTAIELFDGRNSLLFTDTALSPSATMMDRISGNLLAQRCIKQRIHLPYTATVEGDNIWLREGRLVFGSRRIVIVDRVVAKQCCWQIDDGQTAVVDVDYVVLTDNAPITLRQLDSCYRYSTLIITANNKRWRSDRWQREAEGRQVVNLCRQPAQLLP